MKKKKLQIKYRTNLLGIFFITSLSSTQSSGVYCYTVGILFTLKNKK